MKVFKAAHAASTALALVLGTSAVLAPSAHAQTTTPGPAEQTPAPSASTEPGQGLEDIVVTAQRRSENLQRAAVAITAISTEAINRANLSQTSQLTRIAPALQIGSLNGSTTQLYLRGVGNFTSNSLSDAAISVNLDGVPIARTNAVQGIFFDLDRIEVLKGPQGTLYGRNATGGAINVITARPDPTSLGGYVTGEYGNYNAVKFTGAINLPTGEDTAFRLAGIYSDHDGYYSDGTGDEKLRAGRLQMVTRLGDTVKVRLGGDVAHVGGIGAGSTIYGLNRDDRIGSFDPRAGAIYSRTFSPLAGAFLQPPTARSFSDSTYWGLNAQVDVELPFGNLTMIPAYRKNDIRYNNTVATTFDDRTKSDQLSLEVRLASDETKPVSFLVGAFVMDENIHQRLTINAELFNFYTNFKTDTTSYAGFSRLTWRLSDKLRLTGGARYTIDDKSALLDAYQVAIICPSFLAGGPPCLGTPPLPNSRQIPANFVDAQGNPVPVQPYGTSGAIAANTRLVNTPSRTFRKLTYRAGVDYDLGPASLLYASFETGFKAGGFFSSYDNRSFDPETISAFTVGSKNRFMGNRLQLNVEAFWWTYKNQQVSHFGFNSIGGTEFVTDNIGKSRIRGVEVEGRARVGAGTTLSAIVQYLDAKNRSFVYTQPVASGPPVTGCPSSIAGNVYRVDCSGRRAVNAPEWTINGGFEQVFDFQESGKLTFNADGRYQSSSFTGFEQLPQQLQKGYFTLDLQLAYDFAHPHVTVSAFANNVTDRTVVGFSIPHPFGPTLIAESLRPPRVYGVRVGYHF